MFEPILYVPVYQVAFMELSDMNFRLMNIFEHFTINQFFGIELLENNTQESIRDIMIWATNNSPDKIVDIEDMRARWNYLYEFEKIDIQMSIYGIKNELEELVYYGMRSNTATIGILEMKDNTYQRIAICVDSKSGACIINFDTYEYIDLCSDIDIEQMDSIFRCVKHMYILKVKCSHKNKHTLTNNEQNQPKRVRFA